GSALAGLRRQEEAVPVARHPRPDTQLGVAVGRRRVDVVDAVCEQELEDLIGLLLAHRAERRRAEEHAARVMTRATEWQVVHAQPTSPARRASKSRATASSFACSASTSMSAKPRIPMLE